MSKTLKKISLSPINQKNLHQFQHHELWFLSNLSLIHSIHMPEVFRLPKMICLARPLYHLLTVCLDPKILSVHWWVNLVCTKHWKWKSSMHYYFNNKQFNEKINYIFMIALTFGFASLYSYKKNNIFRDDLVHCIWDSSIMMSISHWFFAIDRNFPKTVA